MNSKARIKRLLRPFSFSIPATLNGRRFTIPIIRGTGASHRHGTEPWMIGALQILFELSRRSGLVDIGINIGQTLLKLRSFDETCPYVGFEPNPFCVLYVKELIARNKLQNCTVVPVALAAKAGLAGLESASEADTGASIIEGLRGEQSHTRTEYIATLRFDQVPAELTSAPVVKIDVEGAELDVLTGMAGCLGGLRPFILCEVLHAHSLDQLALMEERNVALMRLLTSHRYDALRLLKDDQWASVVDIEPVTAFPNETYRWNSQSVCDYVFTPKERTAELLKAFAPGQHVAAPRRKQRAAI
jgi:FkbM family methyltransferase